MTICGLAEIPSLNEIPFDHVISINSSDCQMPDLRGYRHPMTLHAFFFHDKESAGEFDPPTTAIVQRLLDIYATTKPDDRMLFHCMAGQCRSTSAAFLWRIHHGDSYEEAYAKVLQVRPIARPNLLMLKLADQLMGHGGKLLEYVALAQQRPEYLRG